MEDRRKFLIVGNSNIGKSLHQQILSTIKDRDIIIITELSEEIKKAKIEKYLKDMEPKIKSPKELKIKAVEQEEAIEKAELNNDFGISKLIRRIPMSNKQLKDRANAKRAKKARKINYSNRKK